MSRSMVGISAIETIEENSHRSMVSKTKYLPTPSEIADKCLEIQATWTDAQRETRWKNAHGLDASDELPVVRVKAYSETLEPVDLSRWDEVQNCTCSP